MNDAPTTRAPRWRALLKVLATIIITIIAIPVALMMLFGTFQQDRR